MCQGSHFPTFPICFFSISGQLCCWFAGGDFLLFKRRLCGEFMVLMSKHFDFLFRWIPYRIWNINSMLCSEQFFRWSSFCQALVSKNDLHSIIAHASIFRTTVVSLQILKAKIILCKKRQYQVRVPPVYLLALKHPDPDPGWPKTGRNSMFWKGTCIL